MACYRENFTFYIYIYILCMRVCMHACVHTRTHTCTPLYACIVWYLITQGQLYHFMFTNFCLLLHFHICFVSPLVQKILMVTFYLCLKLRKVQKVQSQILLQNNEIQDHLMDITPMQVSCNRENIHTHAYP
jgi:hypothetical protein